MVQISVSDTGIGIKKEDMENCSINSANRISTYRKYGSTGLGLLFQRNLWNCMGLDLGRKQYGEGTTFIF